MDFTLLNQAGINTDTAIKRFMGNEALYARMLKLFLDDKTFESLGAAVSEGSNKTALEASHTLKGLCGNLSIDRLFELFSKQVAIMREDRWNDAFAMMPEITEAYDKVTAAIKSWLDMQ